MPDTNLPKTDAPDAARNAPPPAGRPAESEQTDPIRELERLAEQLARQHNRRLLYEYLRARRALR